MALPPRTRALPNYDQALGPVADAMLAGILHHSPRTMGVLLDPAKLNPNFVPFWKQQAARKLARPETISLGFHQKCLSEHMHDDVGEVHLLAARHVELIALSGGNGSEPGPLGPVSCKEDALAVIALMRRLAVLGERTVGGRVSVDVVNVNTQRRGTMHFCLAADEPALAFPVVQGEDYVDYGARVLQLVRRLDSLDAARTAFAQLLATAAARTSGNPQNAPSAVLERALALSVWGVAPADVTVSRALLLEVGRRSAEGFYVALPGKTGGVVPQ
jgi:hypothetical protein